jgi:putative ABC transport system substrate-binding protein
MRRRDFIKVTVGSAAAWPLAARAQSAMPMIGYLGLSSPEGQASFLAGFRKGLNESGYVEGRNVSIEFRWAENQFDRFPALAADLVSRGVGVIFAYSPAAARAAKAETATIPIVFLMGEDPVKEDVVASLNRPSGNVTGVCDFGNQLAGKRLRLLHDNIPKVAVFALLVRPSHPNVESDTKDTQAAASALGLDLRVLTANTGGDFETAFAAMRRLGVGALSVNLDPIFEERREQLVALAAANAIPAIYARREFPAAGGLMSYAADRLESSRWTGIYVGRILKGEKPANMPVYQSTKFDLVINLKTAKALGIELTPTLLATADEVIE